MKVAATITTGCQDHTKLPRLSHWQSMKTAHGATTAHTSHILTARNLSCEKAMSRSISKRPKLLAMVISCISLIGRLVMHAALSNSQTATRVRGIFSGIGLGRLSYQMGEKSISTALNAVPKHSLVTEATHRPTLPGSGKSHRLRPGPSRSRFACRAFSCSCRACCTSGDCHALAAVRLA